LAFLESGVGAGRLLTPDEQLTISHYARHGISADGHEYLYVDAVQLASTGIDLGSDPRAKRTLDAIVGAVQESSTTDNLYLYAAVQVFGIRAAQEFRSILRDGQNISPWRTLEALAASRRASEQLYSDIEGLLDLSCGAPNHLMRHRPAFDAIRDLSVPLKHKYRLLEIASSDECYPESRVSALLFYADIARSNRQFKQQVSRVSGGVMVEEAVKHVLARGAEGRLGVHAMRLGDEMRARVSAAMHDCQLSRDPIASYLVSILLGTARERERRSAAMTLRAGGQAQTVANLIEEVIIGAPADIVCHLARNVLGQLRQASSAETLLKLGAHESATVRAHAAWALGRLPAPQHLDSVESWLARELAQKDAGAVPVALRQCLNTWQQIKN